VHVLLYVAFAKSCANSPRFGIRFILINQILLRALYQTSGNFFDPLHHTATHCNTFQHTATYCPAIWNRLRSCLTVGCNTLEQSALETAIWGVSNRPARPQRLQHTATQCNTLQHNATHCNTLQHTKTYFNILQHTTTHCNVLQHAGPTVWNGLESRLIVGYNTLHRTATRCNSATPWNSRTTKWNRRAWPQRLQYTATHGNTLHYTATYCNTLEHTATYYKTLQFEELLNWTSVHDHTDCNTLQHTATHCKHYNTL